MIATTQPGAAECKIEAQSGKISLRIRMMVQPYSVIIPEHEEGICII